MDNAKTRLVLENGIDGFTNATLEVQLDNGENFRLNFHIPKRSNPPTVREIENAMLRRVQQLAGDMLQT